MGTHVGLGTATIRTWLGHIGALKLSLAGKYHDPFLMYIDILLFELAHLLECDICMLHSAQVRASVRLLYYKVTHLHLETGILLYVGTPVRLPLNEAM